MSAPIVRMVHPSTGTKVGTPAAGSTYRWHDPAVGERAAVLTKGQKLKIVDESIGERTLTIA